MPAGIFGSLEFRTNATQGLDEWQRVNAELHADEKLFTGCDSAASPCPAYIRNWRVAIKGWSSASELEQIERVNAWVNRAIHYTEDNSNFGRSDYWASPLQSLKGRGDCEDYVIAKYASLKALGYGENRLRIVIVNDTRKKIGHAVLSVATAQGTYILDNQNTRPQLHQDISYYAPVYSINASGRWINIAARQIKSRYAKTADNRVIPVPKMKPTVQLNANADMVLPLDLRLRPTFAAGELEPASENAADVKLPLIQLKPALQ